jgi:hypothetical protein
MADLLLKVGASNGYADGDILGAFNRRRIRCVHAEHLCHLGLAGFTRDGLRPVDALARDLREACCQYRFERVSRTEIERVEIATGARVRSGAVPVEVDGQRQQMDVDLFVRRRKRHSRHGLFGTPGSEQWYGGKTDRSDAKLSLVWQAIEAKTARLETEAEFQQWPMGRLDIRSHLPIQVVEFDDATAETLIAPELDTSDPENIVTVQRRQRRVDLSLLGLSATDMSRVRDSQQDFDDRARMEHLLADVVVTKDRVVTKDLVR